MDLDTSTPAGASASAAVLAAYFDTTRTIGLDFIERGPAEPAAWRAAAALNNADVWLTAEEVEAVVEKLRAVLEPYRRRTDPRDHPEGSRMVRVMNVVVPHSHA